MLILNTIENEKEEEEEEMPLPVARFRRETDRVLNLKTKILRIRDIHK